VLAKLAPRCLPGPQRFELQPGAALRRAPDPPFPSSFKRRRHTNMATTGTQPQDVETAVIEALASFGADPEVLTRDATLEEVDVDSLDLVELTQVVEERYEIDLESADFKKIKTVGDVVDLVVARVSG